MSMLFCLGTFTLITSNIAVLNLSHSNLLFHSSPPLFVFLASVYWLLLAHPAFPPLFKSFTLILQFILFSLLFVLIYMIQVFTYLLLCFFSCHSKNSVISYEQTLISAELNILSISILFNTRSIFCLKGKNRSSVLTQSCKKYLFH